MKAKVHYLIHNMPVDPALVQVIPVHRLLFSCFCVDPSSGRNKRTAGKNGARAMHCLRAVAGYRMVDRKHNEDIGEELGMTGINTAIGTVE
jgi:hypothetical protein